MSKTKHKSSRYLSRGTSLHKSTHNTTNTVARARKKEVRKAQKETPLIITPSAPLKAAPIQKSSPAKHLEKTLPPQKPHIEGNRWTKTLQKQENVHGTQMQKASLKRSNLRTKTTKRSVKK